MRFFLWVISGELFSCFFIVFNKQLHLILNVKFYTNILIYMPFIYFSRFCIWCAIILPEVRSRISLADKVGYANQLRTFYDTVTKFWIFQVIPHTTKNLLLFIFHKSRYTIFLKFVVDIVRCILSLNCKLMVVVVMVVMMWMCGGLGESGGWGLR